MLILNPDILTVSLWLSHPMFSFHFIRSYVAPLEFILLQLTFLSSNVNPLEIAVTTKRACVIKDPKLVSLEEQILNN